MFRGQVASKENEEPASLGAAWGDGLNKPHQLQLILSALFAKCPEI